MSRQNSFGYNRDAGFDRRRSADDYSPIHDNYARATDRDRERSPRAREYDKDRIRDRSTVQPPVGPRSENPKRSRPENPLLAETPKSNTIMGTAIDPMSAKQDLIKLFRLLVDKTVDKSAKKQDLATLDRILAQRKEELKASQPMHVEFATVSALHTRTAKHEQKQRDMVQQRYEQVQEAVQKIVTDIVENLWTLKHKATKDEPSGLKNLELEGKLKTLAARVEATASRLHLDDARQVESNEELLLRKARETDHLIALKQENERLASRVTALEQENQRLVSEDASKGSDIAQLLKRVDGLTKLVTQQGENLRTLDASQDEQAAAIRQLRSRVNNSEKTLAEVDPENLNRAADFFAFEKDDMVKGAASQSEKLEKLDQLVGAVLPAVEQVKVLEGLQNQIIQTVGGWVDDLRANGTASVKRIEALEARPATGGSTDHADPPPSEALLAMRREVQAFKEEFEKRTGALDMMVLTLDSQFSNLTTRELFEQIVGHLEKIMPNADQLRQLQQDFRRVCEQATEVGKRQHILEEEWRSLVTRAREPVTNLGETSSTDAGLPFAKRRKVLVETENGRVGPG